MNLASRAWLEEEMDDPLLPEPDYARALADLAALNRITMTHRAVLRWLAANAPDRPFSVLDVASGQGDLLRAIARLARRRGWQASLQGIDLNPRSRQAADAATPPDMRITYRLGDVFAFAPEPPPDFIVTSQFTHHLRDAEIIRLLRWMEGTARLGWMITDLHRHALPYYGFRLLARAMRWHPIVRRDGTLSIARGFRRADWERLLSGAGLQAELRWRLPFRHTLSRLK